MKTTTLDKDNKFSLHNIENYKKDLEIDMSKILNKYFEIITEYLKFIIEKVTNKNYSKFIIIRGLNTITNVFTTLLFYTKNIDLTYFHCQKAFYFYVEFVGQITEDEKVFLQLSSRDASTYVYKKTIYEVNNECKKNINSNNSNNSNVKFDILNSYINIYNIFMHKIIDKKTSNVKEGIISITEIHNKFYACNNNNLNFDKTKVANLEGLIEIINNKIEDINKFFEIINLICKKWTSKPELINNYKKKVFSEEFDVHLNDNSVKFVKWFFE